MLLNVLVVLACDLLLRTSYTSCYAQLLPQYLQSVLLMAILHMGLGAKILAFLMLPMKSHHFAFQPLLRELASRGHHVDYFTSIPMKNPPKNLTEIRMMDSTSAMLRHVNVAAMMKASSPELAILINEACMATSTILYEEEPKIRTLLNSKATYDAVLLSHFGLELWSALCHKFDAPCVSLLPLFDATWANEMAGLPDNPSYMIDFKASTTDKLSFFEKLYNIYNWGSILLIGYYYAMFPIQQLVDRYMRYEGWETRPTIVEMTKDIALTLVNSHHSLGYPYPKAPHVKEVGGINLEITSPLPKDLQDYMDSAEHGIVYFSYGSNVDMRLMMENGKLQCYVNVFKNLKQKVLWKWTGSDIPQLNIPNIKIQEWFPQQSILAHNRSKLFLTHGGLLSVIEAINYGVPVLGSPFFSDQQKNMIFAVNAGIGLELNLSNVTEKSLWWAVNELLLNPRYKNAILKRSELFKDRPMKPIDEAIYWVEYVIKYGKVLQPTSVHMPFYQVYLLDVFGAILVALGSVTYIGIKLVRSIRSSLSASEAKLQTSKLKKNC